MKHDLPRRGALTAALADRYRLERELGAGGMATVYLAHDLRHERQVAIKVLHEDLGATLGPERFLAEIKTTARLQHPHILPLLDSGSAGGLLFYVMPFVPGESLRDRLEREKQLPLEEALRITREVADALGHAHAHGVVHRDIKPENILLQGGHALVADFGIALAVQSAGGARLTQTGLSLGTPQYMSPEQATGERVVDARSDLYALGAVLYEMLTGEPPFTGATVQAIVARVLHEEPRPIRQVRKTVPAHVEAAVLHALAKLPADRWGSVGEFVDAFGPGLMARTATSPVRAGRHPWVRVIGGAAASLGLLYAGILVGDWRSSTSRGLMPEAFDVALPDSAPLFFGASKYGGTELAIAPDASFIVYTALRGDGSELWWRSLRNTEARPLTGTRGAHEPVISPSGEYVAYLAEGELRRVTLASGEVRPLAPVGDDVGLVWHAPDSILVAAQFGARMRWFDASGREIGSEATPWCWLPVWLPGERGYLCANSKADIVRAQSGARDGTAVTVEEGPSQGLVWLRGSNPRLLSRELLVTLNLDGGLEVMRYRAGGAVGRPVPVVPGVRRENTTHAGQFAVSPGGVLVYAPGGNNASGELVATSGDGAWERLLEGPAPTERWDVTPDGRFVAAVVDRSDGNHLRITDRAAGRSWRWLTRYYIAEPRWTVGQALVVNISDDAEGVFEESPLVRGDPRPDAPLDTIMALAPLAWEPVASDTILVGLLGPRGYLGLLRSVAERWVVDTLVSAEAWAVSVSPDRRWVAFTTMNGDGQYEVKLTSYPSGGETHLVSSGGGLEPLWRSASELVFRNDGTWYRVPIGRDARDPVGRAEPWFADPLFLDTPGRSSSLLADGRVVYLRSVAPSTTTVLRVIPGFLDLALGALDRDP